MGRPTTRAIAAVLATSWAVVALAVAQLAHAAPIAERVAVIDLGPVNAAVRAELVRAIVDAGLAPAVGDGVEDALAGVASDRDTTSLAAAMADTERSFGKLDCSATLTAARRALGIAAARQASGIAAPELARAWAYILLCADRNGDSDTAMRAAQAIRTATHLPAEITPALLAKYPDVDAVVGADAIDIDIATDDGAIVWVDSQPVGTAPLRVGLSAGEHVIAAAKGSRRGSIIATAAKTTQSLAVALEDQSGKWTDVAHTIASWRGALPSATDLDRVLGRVGARIAIVRRGASIAAWGHAGPLETPHRLGGDEGTGSLADAHRVANVLADAARDFGAHAPDSDQPLLVDTDRLHDRRHGRAETPTQWWVYAAIGAAFAASAAVVYAQRAHSDTVHVELRYP